MWEESYIFVIMVLVDGVHGHNQKSWGAGEYSQKLGTELDLLWSEVNGSGKIKP